VTSTAGASDVATHGDIREVRDADARSDWERRIYRRLTDTSDADPALALLAPTWVRVDARAGHVRLTWEPVDGAAGYLIQRSDGDADSTEGEPTLLRHGGSDVPAVVGSQFADTSVSDDVDYTYRIATVAGADLPAWHWSTPMTGRTTGRPAAAVAVSVDAADIVGTLERAWTMIGAERLTQLQFSDDGHGNNIGIEFADALRLAHDDLGVTRVRAHAILHDDNNVATLNDSGELVLDFATIDALYDQILAMGVKPVVELSFMPAALARDCEQTVFGYRGVISPPRDWSQWRTVVAALARHLVDRYGIDAVAEWGFEVWNEPNLEVFWTGTRDEYFRLYDESAAAVKSVDERLLIGGPATAAGEWIEALAAHAAEAGTPLDFVTSHTYGNMPVDAAASLERHGFAGVPVWWTEWGVGSTHFGPIHDGAFGAPFVLSGMKSVQGRLQALAYWVISDHFEELGRPPRLFHNGFGLLTVGTLRKPRYWALHLAAHQGDQVLASTVSGDGADVLIQAWATRHDDGTVDVLLWNGTINADLMGGAPALDRHVSLTVTGLDAVAHQITVARIDESHSNISRHCPPDVEWPDAALWTELRTNDELHEERLPDVTPLNGTALIDVDLPMPGVARIRLMNSQFEAQMDKVNAR
jgi:xylan 1,4-beta-xylosidase